MWTDMFTLLLIWVSLHCLAFFAILKPPFLSLSALQTDGSESAWLSLRSCFFFFSFIFQTITPYSSLCTERMSCIYSMTHLYEGARFFFSLLHTIFLHSLRGGIFVWICTLKHIINNPVCSKWMTCPSVAVISWKAMSLLKVGTQVNSRKCKCIHYSTTLSPYVTVHESDLDVRVPNTSRCCA